MRRIHPTYFKRILKLIDRDDPNALINWDEQAIGMEFILDYRVPDSDGFAADLTRVRVPAALGHVKDEHYKRVKVNWKGLIITAWELEP